VSVSVGPEYVLTHSCLDKPGVPSNHDDFRNLAASYRIPSHHIPVTPETKAAAEARLLDLIADIGAELIVLAATCRSSPARCASGPRAG
jgi:formyltetrahydrofolate hydrolase